MNISKPLLLFSVVFSFLTSKTALPMDPMISSKTSALKKNKRVCFSNFANQRARNDDSNIESSSDDEHHDSRRKVSNNRQPLDEQDDTYAHLPPFPRPIVKAVSRIPSAAHHLPEANFFLPDQATDDLVAAFHGVELDNAIEFEIAFDIVKTMCPKNKTPSDFIKALMTIFAAPAIAHLINDKVPRLTITRIAAKIEENNVTPKKFIQALEKLLPEDIV